MMLPRRTVIRIAGLAVALITALASTGLPAAASPTPSRVAAAHTTDIPDTTFQANARELVRHIACDLEADFRSESTHAGLDHDENIYQYLMAKVALLAFQRSDNGGADPELGCLASGTLVPAGVRCVGGSPPSALCLSDQVNDTLAGMQVTAQLGTDGIPCGTPFGAVDGDYDFGLRGLVWLISRFPVSLDAAKPGMRPEVYAHVRDDLLIVSGTPNQPPRVGEYRYDFDGCGNEEHSTGSPGERAGGYEAAKSACEDLLGPGASICQAGFPSPTGDTDEDDFCGSSALATMLCVAVAIVVLALIAIGVGAIAGALLAGLAATGPVGAAIAAGATVVAGGGAALGSALPVVGALSGGSFPETENHILQIETSRVIINELFAHDYELMRTDPDCQTDEAKRAGCVPGGYAGATDYFDITKNHDAQWMLDFLGQTLRYDFVEFNSRPYQRMSTISLLNLYDLVCRYRCDGDRLRLKVAARAILDHVSAKFAVSNSSLRRFVPYRRHDDDRDAFYAAARSLTENGFYRHPSDFQTQRFLMMADPALVPACDLVSDSVAPATPAPAQFCPDVVGKTMMSMLAAAVSEYKVPPELLRMIDVAKVAMPDGSTVMRSGCDQQLQTYVHAGREIYYCDRAFLLAAGGMKTKAAYYTAGFSKGDDEGTAVATTLMPTGVRATLDELIRFEGSEDNNDDDQTNLCVDRGFACGYLPVIPAQYQTLDASCRRTSGDWTFIDTTCVVVPGKVRADMWVAVWCHEQEDCADGDDDAYGLLEVVDASRMKESGATFDEFADTVLARNSGTDEFEEDGDTYRRYDGTSVKFNVEEGVIEGTSVSGMASGDLVIAPADGCEAIIDKPGNRLLILSLVDPQQPFIRHTDSLDTSELTALCAGPYPLDESER